MKQIETVCKIFILLVLLFLYSSNGFTQISDFSYEDKITLEISPDKLTNIEEDSILTIYIFNNSQDTLLTINRNILLGFKSWALPYPSLSYSIPNIMILYSDDFPVSEGFGKYEMDYFKLPEMIVLEPFSTKKFKVNLKKYADYLVGKTWEFKNFFVFAKKTILDGIVKSNYCYEDYISSLNYSETNELIFFEYPEEKIGEPMGNFNLIKEAFNIVIIK